MYLLFKISITLQTWANFTRGSRRKNIYRTIPSNSNPPSRSEVPLRQRAALDVKIPDLFRILAEFEGSWWKWCAGIAPFQRILKGRKRSHAKKTRRIWLSYKRSAPPKGSTFSSLGLAPLQLVLATSRDRNSLPEWYSLGKSWLVLGFIEVDFCR